jgi:histone acetyltransferase (RNA polymerase elongator complex component)
MTRSGYYKPLTVEEAVDRSSAVLEKFIEAGIEVIRIGLCSSDNLISDETYYAGPNHPAIGELVLNELYYKKIIDQLRYIDFENKSIVNVYVSTGALSKAVGQSKRNKLRLLSMPFIKNVRFIESDDILPYEVMVRKENGDRKCI